MFSHLPPVPAGYELAARVKAKWLETSPAIYTLIRAAVHNPANAYFMLLSESCVPLYPARAFYLQVIHSQKSRINGERLPRNRASSSTVLPSLNCLRPVCAGGCEDAPGFGHHDVPQRKSRKVLWCGPSRTGCSTPAYNI